MPGKSDARENSKSAYIGQSVKRLEDYRFLIGRGRFVDDFKILHAAHAAFVRSPHAHARIADISTEPTRAMSGVLAVLTGKDWQDAGLGILPVPWRVSFSDGRPMNEVTRPALALGEVCHVGDTVAAVIAETAHQARNAADALLVKYDDLPAVADTSQAAEANSSLVHTHLGTNIVFDLELGDRAAVAEAFSGATHVTRMRLINNRVAPAPLEPRALVGIYDQADESYTLWAQSQTPHLLRQWIADFSLLVPEHKVRVVSPDVGGGFGQKIYHYPEEPVVLWASRLLGRPVRWTSTRAENLAVDTYGRDHVTECSLALDGEGRFLALDVDTIANVGAYLSGMGAGIPGHFYPPHLTGLYDIPVARCRVRAVYSNTTPVDAYRGAGQPEAAYVVERLIETAARELGIDPCAVRARNVVTPERFPYTNALGKRYDSGDYPRLFANLRESAGYEALRSEQARSRDDGLRLGIGLAGVVESTGAPPSRVSMAMGREFPTFDSASVRVHPSGKVTVFCGAHSQGQGHATTFAQIAAERLGRPLDTVEIIEGDTDRTPFGSGTYGSRSLSVVGIAIDRAAEKIVGKGARIAAHLMECDIDDVVFEDGRFAMPGTNRNVKFETVAATSYRLDNYPEDLEPGLEETVFYDPPDRNISSALHLCVVSVDLETGNVTLRDYLSIDDVGRLINPMVVEGQVQGGIVQGIGQALMEHCIFDGDGQLLTGSFMDYGMPRADIVPSISTVFQETLSPNNVLGVKGVGESGSIGAPAAIVNAVVDALSDLGVCHIDMPLTPMRVWQAIQDAG